MKVAASHHCCGVPAVVVRKQAPEMGLVLGILLGRPLYCTGAMISVIDFMDKLAPDGWIVSSGYLSL